MHAPKDTWKIGELAQKTGLTVRALHHYEAIGLLVPSLRADNNYRLYTREDLVRLQQIVALKELGFTLEKIADTLQGRAYTPVEMLDLQMEGLRRQMASQKKLMERLDGFARLLKSRESPAAEDLLQAIRLSNAVHSYHTEEQNEAIRKRGEKLGRKGLMKAENDWATLIAAVQGEMDKGTDPKSPVARKLAKKWMDLVNAFTGGDPKVAENLRKMYENEPAARHFGPPKEMRDFVDKAMGK